MDTEIIKIILALLVLINPSGALILFLHFTSDYDLVSKRKVAQIACLTVFITIAFFVLFGQSILNGLGISLGSFRVAGGVLLFLIALSMMSDGKNPVKPKGDEVTQEVPHSLGIAVVPLAIPMMIGPGGISTVIIYSAQMQTMMDKMTIIVAGLCISLFCYLSLMAAERISRLLGDTGLSVINRIMGIILAALSIEIIVSGLRAIFPMLA
ncbi:MarC family protein [Moraxella sp.]|uniref:MarC family protein n=1 Tax=Moraxella sp. TaxID=479 RepID=UPI0026DBC79A|nr:MarC family protein [Moraxella sp.]MDO4895456.1 MarC family protein [Moraxella sp.]